MTQPESRTVEEVFAETIWDALSDRGVLRIHADSPKELADITASILAAAKEHGLVIGDGELDAAWKEAEAALPKGWQIRGVSRSYGDDQLWRAWALNVSPDAPRKTPLVEATAPTPAAALHALAEKLRR